MFCIFLNAVYTTKQRGFSDLTILMNKYMKVIAGGALVVVLFLAYIYREQWIQVFYSAKTVQTPEVVEPPEDKVESFLNTRKEAQKDVKRESGVFGKSDVVKVLLVGLDKRLGQSPGHCDVIQFLTIDQKKQEVTITAVPRGTYAPLPPGKAVSSTDYYVSNTCGLVGLEYGVDQIEKIVGQKADYVVFVGFSETLGILRTFKLPTTETLQWLRRRHSYAIGEPQRARNHSTFLKQMMVNYIPSEQTKLDAPLRYMVYKMVQTDLTYTQANEIAEVLGKMDLKAHPERIHLAMKPAYNVQEIPYNSEHLDVKATETLEQIQKKLLTTLEQKKSDKQFAAWAFENDVWLQVEDETLREQIHFDFFERHLKEISDGEKRKELIGDYILEMQYRNQSAWEQKGRELLAHELTVPELPSVIAK